MRHTLGILIAALGTAMLAGCVERRFVITSDPPGTIVLRNYQNIGASPADDFFVYYGNYHFTVIKDGYATLQVDQCVPTPWYEYFPLDFVSENLVPWTIRDVRRFHYQLQPLPVVNTDELLRQGQELRNRGHSIAPSVPAPAIQPAPIPPPTSP